MEPIKVGLMGLGGGGQLVADALLSSTWCHLAVAGSPVPRRVEAFAAAHRDIAVYDDFRSLIVENALEALFVAVPVFRRLPFLSLAAERKLPVWTLAPAARNFEEALEIRSAFDRAECPIAVVRSWDAEPALQADRIGPKKLGRVFLARGSVLTCLPEDLDWRGDSVRAGGGALLDRGYPLIDTIVQVMGVPSTVYAVTAGISRPQSQFPYDTEDTAAVVCHFSGGGIATLNVCWTTGPEQWRVELFGTAGSIRGDRDQVLTRDRDGKVTGKPVSRSANPFLPQIEDFLQRLRTNPHSVRSQLCEHLATMAVLEAAYLSARTGQPESPSTIFEMHDVQEEVRLPGNAGTG